MKVREHKAKVAFVALLVVFYCATLIYNLDEGQRRSLQLKDASMTGNQVGVSFQVISINPVSSEMTARLSFLLYGDIARDPVTPAADLKFFVNGILGAQEIDFPRGKRINPFVVVFAVDGNANRYPFDRYSTSIRMGAAKTVVASRTREAENQSTSNPAPVAEPADNLVTASPLEGEPLPISSSIIASIPGFKFHGVGVDSHDREIKGFDIGIRRANNVIVISVILMTLMSSLALSVLLMCLGALATPDRLELLPLSLCVTLLFGLPALRNSQPDVPPMGVFGDYVSFIWAELIVAVSAVMMIWNWIIRRHSANSI